MSCQSMQAMFYEFLKWHPLWRIFRICRVITILGGTQNNVLILKMDLKKILWWGKHKGIDSLESFALPFPWNISVGTLSVQGGRWEGTDVLYPHIRETQYLRAAESGKHRFQDPQPSPAWGYLILWGFMEECSLYSMAKCSFLILIMIYCKYLCARCCV